MCVMDLGGQMQLSEADTRAKLIDPALHSRDWTEDLIRREETAPGIDIVEGKPRRRQRGRIDYLLRVRVNANSQPVAIALLEAKRSDELNCFLLEERRVAKFKLPERLEFIDELPVTKVGKFEKKSLREKVSAILKAEGNI